MRLYIDITGSALEASSEAIYIDITGSAIQNCQSYLRTKIANFLFKPELKNQDIFKPIGNRIARHIFDNRNNTKTKMYQVRGSAKKNKENRSFK